MPALLVMFQRFRDCKHVFPAFSTRKRKQMIVWLWLYSTF
uniref:Uncharacterized protein n=1 Tax=Arundo donax TaxID=35708 RepID=A0A0A9GZ70_ARUDO